MDSKTRNELEQNELAKWLTHQYEDWIEPNKSWLGYAVLGLLIVIVIIFATARVNAWNRQTEWQQYYAALNSADPSAALELVANSTSSIVGAQARLALAQLQLAEGSAQAFIDRSAAIVLLDRAIISFQQVQRATSDPMILQQAGFGLGQCWETLAAIRIGNDLANAEEEYQRVAERWGDGFMGQRAQKQLALLRQPSTRMFLERMAAHRPALPAGMEGWGGEVFIDPAVPFAAPGRLDLDRFFGLDEPTEEPNLDTEPETESEQESLEQESEGSDSEQ